MPRLSTLVHVVQTQSITQRAIAVSVLQVMAEMQQFQMLAAVSVELVPSRVMLEIYSAPLVPLELLFLMMAPRPQTQILVFVEETLR